MRRNPSSPRGEISTTLKIRSLGREAAANELISERLNHWKAVMRERGADGLPHAKQSWPWWEQRSGDVSSLLHALCLFLHIISAAIAHQ